MKYINTKAMTLEEIANEILFHANVYKNGIIDSDDFTQATEEILDCWRNRKNKENYDNFGLVAMNN